MTDKGLEKLSKELIRQTSRKPAKQIIISELDGGSRPFFLVLTVDKVVQSTLEKTSRTLIWASLQKIKPQFSSWEKLSPSPLRPPIFVDGNALAYTNDIEKFWLHHNLLIKEIKLVLRSKALQDFMRKLLNAGYVNIYNLTDQTQYNIGALRDSIISPLRANILLYKLDCYIENILIPKYIVGDMHPVLAEYKKRLHLNPKDNAFCKDP